MTAARPLRLLVVSSYYDSHLGGLELVAGPLAYHLAASGLAVSWAATDATPAPQRTDLRTLPLPASNLTDRKIGLPFPVPSPRSAAALHRAVAASDVVLIHDTLYLTSVLAMISAKLLGKPTIVLQHIGDALFESAAVQRLVRVGERLVTRPLLKQADQVVFISEAVAVHFAGLPLRRPGLVSFSGIDTVAFRPAKNAAEKARLRDRFGLPKGGAVALYAGRFVGKKGVAYLRDVARLRPNTTFVLAGGGPIEPEAWDLPNVKVVRGLSGAPLADLYRASDVFVLPSPSEGFSLVIREALATGLPVVCGEQAAHTDPLSSRYLSAVPLSIHDPAGNVARLARALDEAATALPCAEAADFARRRYDWRRISTIFRDAALALGGRAPGPVVLDAAA